MQKPLKIIIFDGSFKTTPFINRLAKGLVKEHQVYILGFNEKVNQPIKGVHYIALGSNQNKFRFTVTTLKKLVLSKRIDVWISTLKKMIQGKRRALQQQNLDLAIERIAPDLIHLQWPSTLPWFKTLLTEQKIPVVLSQRGFHNTVRPFVDPDNFQYLKRWYPYVTVFHSVSKAIAKKGDAIWNAPEKLDKVIYTGLPLDKFSFNKYGTAPHTLQLLSIGRPHWIKGYDYALQACKLLKEKGLVFQYTIIGGAGDEELQFLIHNLGLQDCVKLEHRLPQEDVLKKMRKASLLLMPSLEEGLPNVLVEAMAVGLPVLSTRCGGIPELITDGEEGWLVPIRNPTALADGVINFTKLTQQDIDQVKIAARKKIEHQHSEEMMIEGMTALYKEILHKANKQAQGD